MQIGASDQENAEGVRQLLSDPGVPRVLDKVGGAAAEVARAILFEGHAWEFYKAVNTPDHVLTIQTADQQRFANLLLTMGVRMD